jgi:Pyruvate/2-oxoacid:ferredoxin oxidoreductase delta subunit
MPETPKIKITSQQEHYTIMDDIYYKLADHLDNLPAGFPRTESGVELRILKRLFSTQEARLAIGLTMRQETSDVIANRLNMNEKLVAETLDKMASKGLVFRKRKNDQVFFMAAQFVIGIWEYHVKSLDEELIRDFNEYVPYLMKNTFTRQKTQQLRVIPVKKSMTPELHVMPYDDAEQIIRKQSKIVVAPCICRREHKMVGKGCGKPEEACLIFGGGAYYYEENGLGRDISPDEAIEILQKGLEAGLVLQPSNAKKPANICLCCGCCCQILKQLKSLPEPSSIICSNYMAVVDESNCTACEQCAEICQMDAITVDTTASVDSDRCIGCGLCVSICDFEAIYLKEKSDPKQNEPPATLIHTYMKIASERGKPIG